VHVFTLVITAGQRRTAQRKAAATLATLRGIDYFRFFGHWDERLVHARPDDPENVDQVELISRLPSPLPESMIPALYVLPTGRWRWHPSTESDRPRWIRQVNRVVDRHRGGHCIVIADVHV
jgi:hypothetical protein